MATTKIETIGNIVKPEIRITKRAHVYLSAMVDKHTTEVGWLGAVERDGDTFTITDIFYPKHQMAHGTTCEISPAGIAELMQNMYAENREHLVDKIKFWGHSHVNMGCSPSGQDETQGLEMASDSGDFYIRGIHNKKGEFHITFYDMERGLKFIDCDLSVIQSPEEVVAKADAIRSLNATCVDNVALINGVIAVVTNDITIDKAGIEAEIEELKKVNIPATTYGNYGNYGQAGRTTDFASHHSRPKGSYLNDFTAAGRAKDEVDDKIDDSKKNDATDSSGRKNETEFGSSVKTDSKAGAGTPAGVFPELEDDLEDEYSAFYGRNGFYGL